MRGREKNTVTFYVTHPSEEAEQNRKEVGTCTVELQWLAFHLGLAERVFGSRFRELSVEEGAVG